MRPQILDILNKLLAGELTAVDQFLIHGGMYADMGLTPLAKKGLHESEHEHEHARALIQRILFFQALPIWHSGMHSSCPVGIPRFCDEQSQHSSVHHLMEEVRSGAAACFQV